MGRDGYRMDELFHAVDGFFGLRAVIHESMRHYVYTELIEHQRRARTV